MYINDRETYNRDYVNILPGPTLSSGEKNVMDSVAFEGKTQLCFGRKPDSLPWIFCVDY